MLYNLTFSQHNESLQMIGFPESVSFSSEKVMVLSVLLYCVELNKSGDKLDRLFPLRPNLESNGRPEKKTQ